MWWIDKYEAGYNKYYQKERFLKSISLWMVPLLLIFFINLRLIKQSKESE